MKYTHLTQDERYQIALLAKSGHDRSDIARVMNRHKSSIGREMKRNRGERCYRPKQAMSSRFAPETGAMVDVKLGETWSPEQISGYFKVNGQATVSHESIYQRIYADQRAGGTLHTAPCAARRPGGSVTAAVSGAAPSLIRVPAICAL